MKINHKEIPNWIIALTGIILALMAVLSFLRDKPDSFTQHKETVKNQNVGDVKKNERQIIINTGPGRVIVNDDSKLSLTPEKKQKQNSKSIQPEPLLKINQATKGDQSPAIISNDANITYGEQKDDEINK